jgi:hypothetical protein
MSRVLACSSGCEGLLPRAGSSERVVQPTQAGLRLRDLLQVVEDMRVGRLHTMWIDYRVVSNDSHHVQTVTHDGKVKSSRGEQWMLACGRSRANETRALHPPRE